MRPPPSRGQALERRRVIDLLPGRSAEPLRDWLAAHPSVQVVSRDRSGPYAEAVRTGAPTAIQVADRWHLLVNASDALRGIVERHQPEIRKAARPAAPAQGMPVLPVPSSTTGPAPVPEQGNRRRARCETALRLHGEGLPVRVIASRIGASRNAVRRWVRAGRFVPYRRAPGPSQLDQHLPFVEARWREGQRNAAVLHREMCSLGFTGGYDILRHWAARQRRGDPARPPSARIPSSRRITRWLTSDPAALTPEDRRFTEVLCAAAPELKTAAEHVRAFAELLRQRRPAGFDPWLDAVTATELRAFAVGLRQDEAAVRAAMGEPWSNGPVEGQVNRLKLIKRSMYGRASFDLLRQRVLLAA